MTDFTYGARSHTRTHRPMKELGLSATLEGLMKRHLSEELEREFPGVELHTWHATKVTHQLPQPTLWFGETTEVLESTTLTVFYKRGMDE